jgi:hypothetical protein
MITGGMREKKNTAFQDMPIKRVLNEVSLSNLGIDGLDNIVKCFFFL